MKHSIVMIAPANAVAGANALCAALGWGSDNFLVALSADGNGPATHFGLRASEAADFAAALGAALAADPPLNAAMVVDIRADKDRLLHFETLVEGKGLTRVAEDAAF